MTLAFDALDVSDSPLARLDPRWKLATLTLAIVVTGILRTPLPILAALAISALLLGAARLPRRFLFWRVGAFLLFLFCFLVFLPITEGWQGVHAAGKVGSRALAIYTLGLVLVATAPFVTTIQAAQCLGLPRLFAHITLLSYRYIFVLADEFSRVRLALRMRGFRNRMDRHSYRTFGHVAGALLVRGSDRAERIAQAMRCRGFDGRFRTLQSFQTRTRDILFFIIMTMAMGGLLAWDLWLRA
jgi:cobalt/nickel transport system permease protein